MKKKVGKQGTWLSAVVLLVSPVVIILCIRWLLVEPFVIPSASMEPNLLAHDHIIVYKMSYGVKFPFGDGWIVEFRKPKRGDVVVFRYPENKNVFFIKRLIGLPGDKIKVQNGQINLNGRPWGQAPTDGTLFPDYQDKFAYFVEGIPNYEALEEQKKKVEQVVGTKSQSSQKNLSPEEKERAFHEESQKTAEGLTSNIETFDHFVKLYASAPHAGPEMKEITVPEDSYFVMGDNRDQSHDSRFWGFVPRNYIVGKAALIWLSCENTLVSAPMICDPAKLRFDRLMKKVQ